MSSPIWKLIALQRALYDLSGGDREWLRTVCTHAVAPFARSAGIMAWTFDVGPDGMALGQPVVVQGEETFAALPGQFLDAYGAEGSAAAYATGPVATGIRAYGPSFADLCPGGIRDFVALLGSEGPEPGPGVMLGVPSPDVASPASLPASFERVSRHLARALRLRRLLRSDDGVVPECADAVLSPDGRVEHLSGTVRDVPDQEGLRRLARLVERTREGRRVAPEEARAAFEAILTGRWSLVGHTESDGRRCLLAVRNDGGPADPRALPPAERRAVALAAGGASGKQIALALGVDRSRVSRLLRAAVGRLGLSHTVDLPRVLAPMAATHLSGPAPQREETPPPELRRISGGAPLADVVALVETLRPGVGRLTEAERAVAERLVAGASYDEIAEGRGVSRRTVSNQAAAIYRKLGIHGREELAWLSGRTQRGAAGL